MVGSARLRGCAATAVLCGGILLASLFVSPGPGARAAGADCVPRGGRPIASDRSGSIYSIHRPNVRYFACVDRPRARIELTPPEVQGFGGATIELAQLRGTDFAVTWSFLSRDSAAACIEYGHLRAAGGARTVRAVQPSAVGPIGSALVLDLMLSPDGRPAWIGERLGRPPEHSHALRQVDVVAANGEIVVLAETASIGTRLLGWNGRRVRWFSTTTGPRSATVR